MDSAEALFSQHGLYGVTLREVARKAGVDGALLHYYFDSKRGLFDAVFLRRAEILNQERIEALDAYAAAHGDEMTVEGLMEAFLTPVLNCRRAATRAGATTSPHRPGVHTPRTGAAR